MKIDGHQDLIRDESTRAVINNSKADFHTFMQLRKEKLSVTDRISGLEAQVQEMESVLVPRLAALEKLLQELLKRD